MKRVSAIVSATAAVAFLMSGCGTETDGDSETSEGSTAASSTSNSAEPSRTGSVTETAPEPDEEETETTRDEETAELGDDATEPNGAQTTCNQFEALDDNAQIALIEQILAENPESSFAGSPNVALGTAKLVCNSESAAEEPVAVAAEILPR